MSKNNNFHCSFCLRHNFHTKINRDIFVLSFKQIIYHLYTQKYLCGQRKILLSELQDFIDLHEKIGLQNPAFYYDRESMLWFLNFVKIGNTKNKLPLIDVYKTIIHILACFNLSETIPTLEMHKFFQKYKKDLELFFHQRQRKVSIPNLFDFILHNDRSSQIIFTDLK